MCIKVEKEKTHFRWNARDYAGHSGAQQQWARELIAKLCLTGAESLLDVGCGDGKVSAEIADCLQNGRLVGIDSSEEMIQLARQTFPGEHYPNLLFYTMDAQKLVFEQEFDIVFSNAALHWIRDHRPVIKGIHRSLKPGGRALVQMGGRGNAAVVIEAVDSVIEKGEWKQYFESFSFPYGFYSPEEYGPWLLEAGFAVKNLELKPKNMIHAGVEKFKGWFRTTWLPYIQSVPAGQQETFIEAVTGKYLQINPPDRDGNVNTVMQRLEFLVTKA